MNDRSHFYRDSSGQDQLGRPRDRYLDLFQAYHQRAGGNPEPSQSDENSVRMIRAVISRSMRLFREYDVTATRVGERLDKTLLLDVINALHLESFGSRTPLKVISTRNSTQYFLAESLYLDMLEVPLQSNSSSERIPPVPLSPEEWRACLKSLADSISKDSVSFP